MTPVDDSICHTQGSIYEYAAKNGYDMKVFSEVYLKSDFCRRAFDTIYSRFQFADEEECWDFLEPENRAEFKKLDDNKEFDIDVAYWIGFTYRQIYIESGVKSSDLADKITFETMCRYYPGLHTIDEDMAYDIIKKDFSEALTEDN